MMALGASLAFGQPTRQNRSDSLIFVGYTPVGLHIPTLFAPTLRLGFYLGDNFAIGGEIGSWEDSDSDENNTFTGEFSNTGIFIQWWPGTNSFYFSFARHQREWTVTGTTTLPSTGSQVLATMRAKSTVSSLGIGNQWMIGAGGFIQVDWVVFSRAISESVEFEISPLVLAGLTPAEQVEAQQEIQEFGDTLNDFSSSSGAVILTVGWAF